MESSAQDESHSKNVFRSARSEDSLRVGEDEIMFDEAWDGEVAFDSRRGKLHPTQSLGIVENIGCEPTQHCIGIRYLRGGLLRRAHNDEFDPWRYLAQLRGLPGPQIRNDDLSRPTPAR